MGPQGAGAVQTVVRWRLQSVTLHACVLTLLYRFRRELCDMSRLRPGENHLLTTYG